VYWAVRAVLLVLAVAAWFVTGSLADAVPMLLLLGLSFIAERPLRR
jgi:hypothetical protein